MPLGALDRGLWLERLGRWLGRREQHRIAVTQGRIYAPARAYLEHKHAEGKSRREALRCLKRQLARSVYTTLKSELVLT